MIEPGFEQMSEKQRAAIVAEVAQTMAAIWASHGNGEWKKKLLIKDRIADSIFQQILIRPDEYSVLATPNLNGDYLSDAAAAQLGGLGMAPGANIGDRAAVFEATHGTAPKYADKDVINPSSVILSGVMMFEHLGWREVSERIVSALTRTIQQKRVTYDLHRQMEGATKLKTSEFASAIIENM
jgi:isocitrate dehydrogenase